MNEMIAVDLSGTWKLSNRESTHVLEGSVPGCVHLDLLAAGAIPDPYYRDNESRLQWISETDWSYKRTFEVSPELLKCDRILLQCEGLDTFAGILVNGNSVGRADNMFREWEFDIREILHSGENEIEIRFESVYPFMRAKQEERYFWGVNMGKQVPDGRNWIRKEQCNFGWDWGPAFVTCGIWKPIRILGINTARLDSLQVQQKHRPDGSVVLNTEVVADTVKDGAPLSIKARLSLDTVIVAETDIAMESGNARVEWTLENPELWWPNGMGDQPLYHLEISLHDAAGNILDESTKRIGLRSFELVREADEWGQSFKFRINGVDFFAKGANWIPADTFDGRVSDADIRDLMQCSVDANMNCIRVWGGGLYERDFFYDLCDELGLCVWQDFMFACAAYPAGDEAFMENVRIEAIQNVKRLRSHPSVVMWCGNNELEQIPGCIGDKPGAMSWEDYSSLFDELLANVINEHDPDRPYWPSSEHTPVGDRSKSGDPTSGDAHCWAVWHGGEPFEWYRTSFHRFCSEFGFQSFAHPATIESYTLPEDRNITSHIMEHHQKCPVGNAAIIRQMLSWFRLPVGFENTVWLSQILHGLAIKYAVEHWRQNMPRCMGAIYWQLNDCWPVASWSSIDSNHRWKALHYDAKRFFAPYLVSGVEDSEKQTVEIHVTSDAMEPAAAKVSFNVETVDGKRVLAETIELETPSNGSKLVSVQDLSDVLKQYSARDIIVFMMLEVDGETVSRNMLTLKRPKHLNLKQPHLQAELVQSDSGEAEILVRTDKPALWVWLAFKDAPDIRFSDNFFHLLAGEEKRISLVAVRGKQPVVPALESLQLLDLTSTYAE